MTLKWNAQGKECNIKINIHDNGSVELLESNGVTEEQLRANKELNHYRLRAERLDIALEAR
ncbi:MAG: hypothetical protein ACR5LA_13535 [Wolbachia sp.]